MSVVSVVKMRIAARERGRRWLLGVAASEKEGEVVMNMDKKKEG